MTNENTGVKLEYTEEFESFWSDVKLEYTKEFESFWSRVVDQINGFYVESELPALKERMSNYFADFPTIEDLDDIDKYDLIDLLFSEDFYADIKR